MICKAFNGLIIVESRIGRYGFQSRAVNNVISCFNSINIDVFECEDGVAGRRYYGGIIAE